MRELSLRAKALFIGTAFTIIAGGLILYSIAVLRESKAEVIRRNSELALAATRQLSANGQALLDSLWTAKLSQAAALTTAEQKRIDSLLTVITSRQLASFSGVEGGYYLVKFDLFVGFSFPTAREPKPAYGPPPREFHLIRNQIQQSLAQRQALVRLHQFEPTVFPLATAPLIINGEAIAGVWAMIRVEAMLPSRRLTRLLNFSAVASLLGIIVAIVISWILRKRVEEIKLGLEILREDTSFRFPPRRGVLGSITRAINEMVLIHTAERKRREELERELRQREKLAALGKLVAGVAHEVKTPLATLKTRIQMWQRKLRQHHEANEPCEVISEESMRMVIQEIDRLADLVKRLLIFSKPVANNMKPANLHQVIEQTLTLIQAQADEQHIDIVTRFDSNVPPITLDPTGMEQVFLNICTNALEAMPEGGKLYLSTDFLPWENAVRITVRDSGKGIPLDILDKVFDPFFTTKEQGVGLGLSIAYEIVQAHGGKIEFVPSDDNETVCRVTLPVKMEHH
ncbi:MAG: ATP-binding protein [candidate division KSB1 bacterium]|nr:ATP-binding protein [candidate division KSB1 bacterium]MDZ7303728.1 ATP-binding protein [candidate division KSB1 bacterium]MDZ7313135.1 ATP-binding protein [candidate division KSB1 bacterium]